MVTTKIESEGTYVFSNKDRPSLCPAPTRPVYLSRKSTKLLTMGPHCHVIRTDDKEAVNQPPSMHTHSTALAFEFMALPPSLVLFCLPLLHFHFSPTIFSHFRKPIQLLIYSYIYAL